VVILKTVLLKFSGPLQAWGTDSHFETRHTDSHPSKSGVIGMIAAGLGYSRDDDAELQRLNTLSFAVRIDQKGSLLKDFHTAEKYKGTQFDRNYVTNRWYLQDAVFVAALGSEDEALINDVKVSVTEPYFQLYLGRRSLPPTADLLLGIFDLDPISCLKSYPWQASRQYQEKNSSHLEVFSDASLVTGGSIRTRNDEVVSFSQSRGRKFNPRTEKQIWVDAVQPARASQHDAFGAVEED
jgi:CRISPR system Cascade subunit CasD